MKLAEFPLGDPEAGGFEWSGSAIGRADCDDDVTALIVPRMPHHVAPQRSPSAFHPQFSPGSLPLSSCLSLSTGLGKVLTGYSGKKKILLLYLLSALSFANKQSVSIIKKQCS